MSDGKPDLYYLKAPSELGDDMYFVQSLSDPSITRTTTLSDSESYKNKFTVSEVVRLKEKYPVLSEFDWIPSVVKKSGAPKYMAYISNLERLDTTYIILYNERKDSFTIVKWEDYYKDGISYNGPMDKYKDYTEHLTTNQLRDADDVFPGVLSHDRPPVSKEHKKTHNMDNKKEVIKWAQDI